MNHHFPLGPVGLFLVLKCLLDVKGLGVLEAMSLIVAI